MNIVWWYGTANNLLHDYTDIYKNGRHYQNLQYNHQFTLDNYTGCNFTKQNQTTPHRPELNQIKWTRSMQYQGHSMSLKNREKSLQLRLENLC